MAKIVLIALSALFLSAGSAKAQEKEVIELSLSDCLTIGLNNNLDIKIAKAEAKIKDQGILLAQSVFDTILNFDSSYTDDQLERPNPLYGTKSLTTNYSAAAAKTMPTGTELEFGYSDTRSWNDQLFTTINPQHEAELSFSIRQPVAKNILGYIDRSSVTLSRIEARIGGIEALDKIENAVSDIEKAYWRLVYEYENVALYEKLLEQATKLYGIYERHLKTGFAEITDVLETEANMRIRKTDLAVAENDLITASNELRYLLNEWGDFIIKPEDKLETLGEEVNLVESMNEAFSANRVYKIRKKELEARDVTLKMKSNSLWPEVDLVGSYTLNGIDRKAMRANRELTSENNPEYYAGIEISYPLENSAARSGYNTAKLEKKKALLEILKVEKRLATSIDMEVRNVNVALETARRRKLITEIQYKKFTEEEKKLKRGRSTSKIVIDYQNDLTMAAIRQYLATLEYYRALIDLENAKDTLLAKVGVLER